MKFTMRLLANVGLPLLAILSISSVSAQSSVGKTILEKLTARVSKLESACAKDIKKYCRTESVVVTRFGGKREPTWYPYTKARRRLIDRVAQAFNSRDLKRRLGLRQR